MKDSYLDKLDQIKKRKKKLTIYLSPETSKLLKVYAAENDKKMSDVAEEVLASKLQSAKK
jgi:hypothetical protein